MKAFLLAVLLLVGAAAGVSAQIPDTVKVHPADSTAQPDTTQPVVLPSTSPTREPIAKLYVYRPRDFVGSAINYDLHLGDSIICRVKNNSKYEVPLYTEGKTEVWAKTEAKRGVTIDVKPGKSYYIRCGVAMGILAGRPVIEQVYPEQGEMEYQNVEGRKDKGRGN